MRSEAALIRKEFGFYHDGKCGYVVYRCVYGDDEKWARFVDRLTAYANIALDRATEGHLIKDDFAFDIRDNAEELNRASKAEVRKIHNKWVASVNGPGTLTKYTNPIYVDEEVMNSVLEGDDPDSTASRDILQPRAFVKLLDDLYEEEEVVGEDDEGFPPIEGCKREDVGWLKMPARYLMPRGYALLMNNGWQLTYRRPPRIVQE